jgi:DNA-binding Lrp family transcriptional regulator
MSRPSVGDRRPAFKRAVFAGRIPDSVKVLLLRLLEDMSPKLVVSVPRSKLAEDLGVPLPRISERVKVAREKGYLSQVRRGRQGVTAVYQGMVQRRGTESVPLEVRHPVPSRGTESVPVSPPLEVRPDHTQVGKRSVPDLPVCECHGVDDCISLTDHREASA